jgi:hypothetical protein
MHGHMNVKFIEGRFTLLNLITTTTTSSSNNNNNNTTTTIVALYVVEFTNEFGSLQGNKMVLR